MDVKMQKCWQAPLLIRAQTERPKLNTKPVRLKWPLASKLGLGCPENVKIFQNPPDRRAQRSDKCRGNEGRRAREKARERGEGGRKREREGEGERERE